MRYPICRDCQTEIRSTSEYLTHQCPHSKNAVLLESFTKFCQQNPALRFWQALATWTHKNIYVGQNGVIGEARDTYYFEGRDS